MKASDPGYADGVRQRLMDRHTARGECWEWNGYRDAEGYGYTTFRAKRARVHRVAYELMVGTIPEGLTLDHLCRNRACFNPAHLDPVPIGENVRRGEGATFKETDVCPNGHAKTSDNVRIRVSRGRTYRTCRECVREAKRRADRARRAERDGATIDTRG